MPVIQNGKKIIPAPLAEITKEFQRSEDGTPRSVVYNITLHGNLVAFAGSPRSDGSLWTASGYPPDENIPADSRLASLRNKKGALCELFCEDGKILEIQPFDGTLPIKCNPRVRNIQFAEGRWFDVVPYTITLEADKIWFGSFECCSEINDPSKFPPEESWSIEQADDKGITYRLTHTISAQRKDSYDTAGNFVKRGWENARDIVVPYLGIDLSKLTGSNARPDSFTGFQGYNYVRSEQIDETGGKYSVTETWLVYNPSETGNTPCLEDYTVNVRKSDSGRVQVTVDGTLTGLEVRNNASMALASTRWTNAQARWAQLEPTLFGICQDNAGVTLNPALLNSTVGSNQRSGVISFSKEFDNRPQLISGAINATIQSNERYQGDVFAAIAVLGRTKGPILQDIQTKTPKGRSLSIEANMPAATYSNPAGATKPNTDSIVASYRPTGTKVFKERDEDNWVAESGRYSRQVSWTYES